MVPSWSNDLMTSNAIFWSFCLVAERTLSILIRIRNTYVSTNYVRIIYDWAIRMRFSKFIRPTVRNGKGWAWLCNYDGFCCREIASIVHVGEPLLRFKIANYLHDGLKQKSCTRTPVRIREPRLLEQWALASSLFEAPRRRPSLRRDSTIYIAWQRTWWISQSDRLWYLCSQQSENTSRHRLTRNWYQRRQEQLLLQRL